MEQSTDLANRVTISAMVDAYKQSKAMVTKAYADLFEAKKILEAAFGKDYTYFDTLPDRHSYSQENVDVAVMLGIKQRAWRVLIDRLEIRKLMSIKATEDLDKKLEDAKAMPEIELGTVFDILKMLADQTPDYAKAAVLEVFELLRPAAQSHSRGALKTNQRNGKFSLGKKIILSWIVEHSYSSVTPLRVRYGREKDLLAVDKVFHQLDGAGIPEGYRGELVEAINSSTDGYGETDYFKFRACGNMNLHLEFKRLDLVNDLNRVAGNPTQLRD